MKAAFDAQGNPTRAAEGFARSQGIAVSEIIRKETPRGLYCAARKRVKGRSAAEILSEALPKITLEISFPKSMVWLSGERALRPAGPLAPGAPGDGGRAVHAVRRRLRPHDRRASDPLSRPDRSARRGFRELQETAARALVVVDIDERKAAIRSDIEKALLRTIQG